MMSESQTVSANNGDDAHWSSETIAVFVSIMYDEVIQGNLVGANFTNAKWTNIYMKMQNVCPLQVYTVKQLQGKFTRFKVKWKKYYNLLNSQTGMGWDDATNMVTGTEEQWARWLEANPRDASLRRNGCPHYRELTTIFAPHTATGGMARASTQPPMSRGARRQREDAFLGRGSPSLVDDNEEEGSDNSTSPQTQPVFSQGYYHPGGSSSRQRKGGERAVVSALNTWERFTEKVSSGCDPTATTTVEMCIDKLNEIPDLPEQEFYAACKKLEDPVRRRMDNEDDHVDDVNEINDRVSNVENDVYDDAIPNQYLIDQVNAGMQNFMYYYNGPLKRSFANIFKTPYRTSNQKGLDWLNELLVGHEDRFKDNLRMTRETFLLLCHKIRKTDTEVQWEENAGPSQFARVPELSDNDLWQQSMLRDAIAQQLWDAPNHHG
ncbi:hypothetical protein BUALT_Bualt07G0119200 [Buddleja alternifolia]|uniref:Myb/SANT-like domain-containing protein n=1 Tax=Buddleja alternifolia TaxID=168488 RepID=A0AAV6XA06_9LAMI|nr:hypothetical protein BUALT_Bualt07G0119200 [Buddleja alternifolia]